MDPNLLLLAIEFMISRFFFVVPMLVGGLAFWLLLRLMSLSVKVKWAEMWEQMRDGNLAVGLYFGLRAVAVAIATGLFAIAGALATQLVV